MRDKQNGVPEVGRFSRQMLRAREEWENLRGKSPEASFRKWRLAVLDDVSPQTLILA
jgi:hypothetical protein